jgi:transcriptional regulator with XRE-family HTH domain
LSCKWIATTPRCHFGKRLRRFRRLRGVKQEHVAEILGVSQGMVSRWEAGAHTPSADVCAKIERLLTVAPDSSTDRALRRLVEAASMPVHLICDDSHALLAASAAREAEWEAAANAFLGTSLWRFATRAILVAEGELADHGWFDRANQERVLVATEGNGSREMRILPSTLEWEQISLADGRTGRLVTTASFA